MPRRREMAQYQQVSAFERGRMVGLRKQVCHTLTLRLVQGMLLRQLCVYETSGEKRVVRRDEQVLDHVMWPQYEMPAILSAWPWLEYCNGFGPVCFNSSSPSCEGWTSCSHAIASASIVHRPPTPQTTMSTWTPSLAFFVAKCSVFGRVPLQHVLQWWSHTCSTLPWWTQSESLHSSTA